MRNLALVILGFLVFGATALAQEDFDGFVDTRDVFRQAVSDVMFPAKAMMLGLLILALVVLLAMRKPMVEDLTRKSWETFRELAERQTQRLSQLTIGERLGRLVGDGKKYLAAIRRVRSNLQMPSSDDDSK
ncbi:MAG: hypothetical protein HUU49_02310 [Candidatus Buchananbacteria bacterium]|nr:hypothetical protein [Candidatus Buchananbacteria bacterium]